MPEIFRLRSQKRTNIKYSSRNKSDSKRPSIFQRRRNNKSNRTNPSHRLLSLGRIKYLDGIVDRGSRPIKVLLSRLSAASTSSKALLTRISQIQSPFRRTGENRSYTFKAKTYPGSRTRRYTVHIPPGYNWRRSTPLVMVLHGCLQCDEQIQHVSNFDAIADKAGFVVVYPFVTSYSGLRIKNCWGWWSKNQIEAGGGEVEDLWGIIEQVKAEFNIDRKRIHVAGLSSGAAMATAMMVVHGHKIASGGTVAGVPYSETQRAVATPLSGWQQFKSVKDVSNAMTVGMDEKKRNIPIFIVHSKNDRTVDIQAAYNIRDSWAECFEIDISKRIKVNSGKTFDTPWVHTKYLNGSRKTLIETLFVEGPDHGWYGGKSGDFSYPEAPNISRLFWNFFRNHRL